MVPKGFLKRVAHIAAALFIGAAPYSFADISMNGLIEYFSGLSGLPGDGMDPWSKADHPALMGETEGSYIEINTVRQEDVRTFRGSYKRIGLGETSVGFKRNIIPERAGVYFGYRGVSNSASWPFSHDRIRIREAFDSNTAVMSGYVSGGNARGGVTLGRELSGERDYLGAIEIQGTLPFGIKEYARYASKPAEWHIALEFEDIGEMLPSQLRTEEYENRLSVPFGRVGDFGVNYRRIGVSTPSGFKKIPSGHLQAWNAERSDWQVEYSKSIQGAKGSILYGEGRIEGEIGLLYDTSRYMGGKGSGPSRRFRMEGSFENRPSCIPSFRYDRAVTELFLSHGIFYSWPFTPSQIEIIGDKTWTFSGNGRIACNSGTLTWGCPKGTLVSCSYTRAYLDYSVRITTRDHLSLDPWDMLFGRVRYENDNTRFFDFAAVTFVKNKSYRNYIFSAVIRQFIPLYHAAKVSESNAPDSSSFPKLKFKSPATIGGLTFGFHVRYTL